MIKHSLCCCILGKKFFFLFLSICFCDCCSIQLLTKIVINIFYRHFYHHRITKHYDKTLCFVARANLCNKYYLCLCISKISSYLEKKKKGSQEEIEKKMRQKKGKDWGSLGGVAIRRLTVQFQLFPVNLPSYSRHWMITDRCLIGLIWL